MAVDERVIVKIRKLMALGTSSNEHEAAAAIAKAQELMLANDLEMADIKNSTAPETSIVEDGGTVVRRRGKPDDWREGVFRAVAETSDVYLMGHYTGNGDRGYKMVGRKRDVEMAAYAADFLQRELERLAGEYRQTRWQEIWDYAATHMNYSVDPPRPMTHQEAEADWKYTGRKHPLTAGKSWLEGAAVGVAESLRQSRAEMVRTANANALVVRKMEDIYDYIYMQRYGMTFAAYKAQQAAGANAVAVKVTARPETDAQRRAREAKEARDSERWYKTYYAQQDRLNRARDHEAYSAGLVTGRQVGVRPGVAGGTTAQPMKIER